MTLCCYAVMHQTDDRSRTCILICKHSNFHTTGPTSRSVGVAKMRLKDKGASYRRHARTAGNKSKTTHGPTLRGNWPEGEREKKKKTPPTSHQRKGATGHHSQREGGRNTPPLPLSTTHTHTHPPSSSPALPVPPMGRGNAHKSSQGSG